MDAEENSDKFLTHVLGWKPAAVFGTVTGILLYRGDNVCQYFGASPSLKLANTLTKRFRLSGGAVGAINGGLVMGTGFGMYFGVQNLLAEERRVLDLYNPIVAGLVANATTTRMTLSPGVPMHQRAFLGVFGSVVGTVQYFPIGWCYMKVLQMLKTEDNERRLKLFKALKS